VSLPEITAKDLPRQAYAHSKDHEVVLTLPEKFRPVVNSGFDPKPTAGGMWTAPVTDVDHTGGILSTEWTDWCRSEHYGSEYYTHFLEIAPNPDFRGLVIDGLDDLRAIMGTYEGSRNPRYAFSMWAVLDFEQMAADGIDAVFLTGRGQMETRFPEDRKLSLYGWDAASVLWVRSNYRVVS
jgi:hypothetical protein